ncbi:hypothetical protein LXL04_033712 [Taraxacum kok-saghyz]
MRGLHHHQLTFNSMDLPLTFCMPEQIILTRKVVNEIVEMHWSPTSHEHLFTVLAKVEKLLDSSTHKFVNRLGIGNGNCPEQICDLVERSFAFKIRLPNYFHKDSDFHNYRVLDLFEIDTVPVFKVGQESRKKKPVPSAKTTGSVCKVDTSPKFATPEKKKDFQRKK